jgi:hypothetical protein
LIYRAETSALRAPGVQTSTFSNRVSDDLPSSRATVLDYRLRMPLSIG